jgi:hypothetical protein
MKKQELSRGKNRTLFFRKNMFKTGFNLYIFRFIHWIYLSTDRECANEGEDWFFSPKTLW